MKETFSKTTGATIVVHRLVQAQKFANGTTNLSQKLYPLNGRKKLSSLTAGDSYSSP
jgi:hypothetical protein